jgi:hypothetical protein
MRSKPAACGASFPEMLPEGLWMWYKLRSGLGRQSM